MQSSQCDKKSCTPITRFVYHLDRGSNAGFCIPAQNAIWPNRQFIITIVRKKKKKNNNNNNINKMMMMMILIILTLMIIMIIIYLLLLVLLERLFM